VKIVDVRSYPLTVPIAPEELTTAFGAMRESSILLVEVVTEDGISGFGEGLARYAPAAYARLVDQRLKPVLIGEDAFDVEKLWQRMSRVFTGKSGGILIEALSAVDMALWDAIGKALGQPVWRLLGGNGRRAIPAYASSITWSADALAEAQTEQQIARGFRTVKVKLGAPLDAAIARARLIRRVAGDRVRLCADANWAFDLEDSVVLGRELAELGYIWFEEPMPPEDVDGYCRLAERVPIRIAAGESEHTASGARDLIGRRGVGLIQPDVARSGGITETRRIGSLAHAFNVAYAPHIGQSGAVCEAASLHLCASLPNTLTFECMYYANPLRERLTRARVADPDALVDGCVPVPQGPGLGFEIDREVVRSWLAP
jgi:L-alanine-DL-glutamate epimerase-like enolase superfamily enzyme